MSWHPNDLVTDADLLAYEPTLEAQFNRYDWVEQRRKALDDWLWPSLVARGFDPDRLRTRVTPTAVYGYTSAAFSDVTAAAKSRTADDLLIGAILTGSTAALYVGHTRPFRGVSLRIADTPSTASSALTVALWQDAWTTVTTANDGLQTTNGLAFSRGGAVTWSLPATWVERPLNSSDPLYWARFTVSAAITSGAKAGQLGVIRRSLFSAPVVYKTLEWVFRSAQVSQEGPWRDKAEFYAEAAATALVRALDHAGGEFDTDTIDDIIDATEAAQTVEEAGAAGAWTWERA